MSLIKLNKNKKWVVITTIHVLINMLKRFQGLGSLTGTKRSRGGLTRTFLGAAQTK